MDTYEFPNRQLLDKFTATFSHMDDTQNINEQKKHPVSCCADYDSETTSSFYEALNNPSITVE